MKGIMFRNWKVRAIADSPLDKEWQTRRIIKDDNGVPNSDIKSVKEYRVVEAGATNIYEVPVGFYAILGCNANQDNNNIYFRPRYQPGETVYIKEAWAIRGDGQQTMTRREYEETIKMLDLPRFNIKFKSPLFMPESEARYFIRITDVRAERVQDISEEDAIAEGCNKEIMPGIELPSAKRRYSYLWDSINKSPYDWQANPYVWVYSFKKVEV